MHRETAITGSSTVGVLVGLVILLYGVYAGSNVPQAAGGVVVLASIGVLTAYLDRL